MLPLSMKANKFYGINDVYPAGFCIAVLPSFHRERWLGEGALKAPADFGASSAPQKPVRRAGPMGMQKS